MDYFIQGVRSNYLHFVNDNITCFKWKHHHGHIQKYNNISD